MIFTYHDTHLTPLLLGLFDLFTDLLTYSTQDAELLNQTKQQNNFKAQ